MSKQSGCVEEPVGSSTQTYSDEQEGCFQWSKTLHPCGLWGCPFEKTEEVEEKQMENRRDCFLCSKPVPIRGLLPCPKCEKSICILCQIETYVSDGKFCCPFCHRKFSEVASDLLLLFYRAHQHELQEVTMTTAEQPSESDEFQPSELVVRCFEFADRGDPSFRTLYELNDDEIYGEIESFCVNSDYVKESLRAKNAGFQPPRSDKARRDDTLYGSENPDGYFENENANSLSLMMMNISIE